MDIVIDGKSIFDCTAEELDVVFKTFKLARELIAKKLLLRLTPGIKVCFEHKRGRIYAKVVKCNEKTASVVTEEGTTWRVSPGLLTIIGGDSHEGNKAEERN